MFYRIPRRLFVFGSAAALTLGCSPAGAETARKDIDLRISPAGTPTWILFFARKPDVLGSSFAGHAFVGVGSEDPLKKQSWFKAFGLYPKDHLAGVLSAIIGPVPGELKTDAFNKSDFVLSCMVSSREFTAIDKIIDNWIAKTKNSDVEYTLMYQDCVSFSLEVAAALRLKLPPRQSAPNNLSLPVTLIQKLAELNDTISFGNGLWTSNDVAGRWKLEIDYDTVTWTEKIAGQTIMKSAKLIANEAPVYTIIRDNTEDVLQFLGARDSVRQAILSQKPAPSYMKLTRTTDKLFTAQWFGLKWELDKNGKLTKLQQPGSQPASAYNLVKAT